MIPKPLRAPLVELFHAVHPGQIGMLDVSEHAFWPRMKRELIFKAQTCKACTQIGKNLKSMTPKNKSAPLALLREPNEEIQLDFCGPVTNERGKEQYILTCIDRFSKFPTAKIYNSTNASNVTKFLEKYIDFHGVPRSIRCDQGTCFTSKVFEDFCDRNNIKVIYSPVDDHRATGLVERFIRTLREKLGCMKQSLGSNFKMKQSIRAIITTLRGLKHRSTHVAPFEAHFGRCRNTALRNLVTKASRKNLGYPKSCLL